jgi:hypothetical protein
MIQKVCKLSSMRTSGLNVCEERGVRARPDSTDVGAPITTGEAVLTKSGGS